MTTQDTLTPFPPYACPEHRETLTERSGEWVCPRGHAFPVVDGIVRFVELKSYADGFGAHVPKGYIYTAMAFSAGIEGLNMLVRKRGKPSDHS